MTPPRHVTLIATAITLALTGSAVADGKKGSKAYARGNGDKTDRVASMPSKPTKEGVVVAQEHQEI